MRQHQHIGSFRMYLPSSIYRKRLNAKVLALQGTLSRLDDSALRSVSLDLRASAQSGKSLRTLLVPAFALVREAAIRIFGYGHHDVQLLGGMHLALERVIEMETGQGKTLTAILPLYLYALQGRGAHLATSNDYLAKRDAETMGCVFDLLGMSCGYIVDQMPDDQRREAYACDITYGTGSEFGFDFLRDRLKRYQTPNSRSTEMGVVQRDLHFILADEADALLIDDANTPMILGAAGESTQGGDELYSWFNLVARYAREGREFSVKSPDHPLELTDNGRMWVRERFRHAGIDCRLSPFELYEGMQKALTVLRNFHRDKQYIIRDQEVVLVNEQTGRLGEGRQLQNGLHQLIQAREGVPITPPNSHAARVTVQCFFLLYKHLAGMSGTVMSAAREFRRVYNRPVVRIPTAVPSRRQRLSPQVFASGSERWQAVCAEVEAMLSNGRSVLVGTRSVEKSEELAQVLRRLHISHNVLNARLHAEEAEIVQRAGHPGSVTVATGMAGRGTDIKLVPSVRDAGGLHVILTEMHDSCRADLQLIGRCGRQGDPGSFRQYLSADDEVLDSAHGAEGASRTRQKLRLHRVEPAMQQAQRSIERRLELARTTQLQSEERKMKSLKELGLDPILDVLS